jgi:predicted transcriptional regulator
MLKSSRYPVSAKTGAQVMSPEQSRAARGWLGWSQDEFAQQANVALRTIASFERGEIIPRPNNIAAMRRAVEEAGIRLIFDRTGMAAGIARDDADIGLPGELSV